MAKVLVVGGAGYVGSAACAWLLDKGHDVWVLDDLSTGHRELVLSDGFTLSKAGDSASLKNLFSAAQFDCVMHFAAFSLVGESMTKRDAYFDNNVLQTQTLLEVMLQSGIKNFVFSSSCAVFGDPGGQVINETLPKHPINPYGETKLAVEDMLGRLAQSHGLNSIALRYFNAAGAEPKLRVGEWHSKESHLIPNVLKAVLEDRPVQIFGNTYPTPDGTCVRDFIHVTDLAAAHESAMCRLLEINQSNSTGNFSAYNLGSEKGSSVLEVIQACEKVIGRSIKKEIKEKRPGDPSRLIADSSLARRELNYKLASNTLDSIIQTAWSWENKLREPRKAVFLDRDGTLNDDPGYINDPNIIKLFPGVGDALLRLKKAGYLLIVVSNQSGVGRGLIKETALPLINDRLNQLLKPSGVKIDHFELCYHHPDKNCECRKPKPKMILDAAKKFNVALSASFVVGDKESDLHAGRNAACKAVALVRTGNGQDTEKKVKGNGLADFIGDSLGSVVDWILDQETAKP